MRIIFIKKLNLSETNCEEGGHEYVDVEQIWKMVFFHMGLESKNWECE